jgi:hypothetical protein
MMKRYLAVIRRKNQIGYAIDYYPNELRRYTHELGDTVIGDFAY